MGRDDGDGPRWVGPTGNGPRWARADGEWADGGCHYHTHHYHMTSRMPSSAREEGFQIFMYFVHYNHFSRLQID